MMAELADHQHGKSKVRLARTWRVGEKHYFVEWSVSTMLESDMAHAFLHGSNAEMTATDTQRNMVYFVAKQCARPCTLETYAEELARAFVKEYPKVVLQVSKAKVWVEGKPWERVSTMGAAHNHGFALCGSATRTCYVSFARSGELEIVSGVKNWSLLKTTQSGYEGYLKDRFTRLPETRERIVASAVTATWKYSAPPVSYDDVFDTTIEALSEAFFGPPDKGVYSPSVQYTLFQMAKAVIQRVPQVESVYLNMPNLHMLPCPVVESKFEDDVYIATSEPHGNIEATVTRGHIAPHCKL